MARSTTTFDRWTAHEPSTWSLHMYNQYNSELVAIQLAQSLASKKLYSDLGKSGVKWSDSAISVFGKTDKYVSWFPTLKSWSDQHGILENWIILNATLTDASNLETYLASVIRLAIDSDPGLLIGASRAVDGAALMKAKKPTKVDADVHIRNCTMGDWGARLSALEKLFGPLPSAVMAAHSELEAIRGIRNRAGHAFGRDIDAARRNGVKTKVEMEKLGRGRGIKLRLVLNQVARAIDRMLLANHIGDFEAVQFYAKLEPMAHDPRPMGQQAVQLKSAIGSIGALPRGKVYCQGLIQYWNAL